MMTDPSLKAMTFAAAQPYSIHLEAAVDRQIVSGGKTGLLTCEERYRVGHLVWSDESSHRRGRSELTHPLRRKLLGHCRSAHGGRCDKGGGDPVRCQLECDESDELVSAMNRTNWSRAAFAVPSAIIPSR